MTSHELAARYRLLADFLESRPAFELDTHRTATEYLWYHDKDMFIKAAKTLGQFKKSYDKDDFVIKATTNSDDFGLFISIPRNRVCRKVQDEKWECEPLLSQEELADLPNTGEDSGAVDQAYRP